MKIYLMKISLLNKLRTVIAIWDMKSACRKLDKIARSEAATSLFLSVKKGVGAAYYTSDPKKLEDLFQLVTKHYALEGEESDQ